MAAAERALAEGADWLDVGGVKAGPGPPVPEDEELDLPLGAAGRLGFAVVGPAFRLMLRRSLRRLARMVESKPRPRTGPR